MMVRDLSGNAETCSRTWLYLGSPHDLSDYLECMAGTHYAWAKTGETLTLYSMYIFGAICLGYISYRFWKLLVYLKKRIYIRIYHHLHRKLEIGREAELPVVLVPHSSQVNLTDSGGSTVPENCEDGSGPRMNQPTSETVAEQRNNIDVLLGGPIISSVSRPRRETMAQEPIVFPPPVEPQEGDTIGAGISEIVCNASRHLLRTPTNEETSIYDVNPVLHHPKDKPLPEVSTSLQLASHAPSIGAEVAPLAMTTPETSAPNIPIIPRTQQTETYSGSLSRPGTLFGAKCDIRRSLNLPWNNRCRNIFQEDLGL
ncbi:hypothetical protein TWF696_002932 [Orbilia brochopaga]|uniref:Uncharacterized protein n=1 Tax=Orbilia brochopaga TaxID=3140254 RepID=A0AAV9U339_9PEZI